MRHIQHELALLATVSLLGVGAAMAAETGTAPQTSANPVEQTTAVNAPKLELSDAQRQAIVEAVVPEQTHQATPKEFKAEVGSNIPRTMDLHPLPRPLVYEIPALKEYMFAHLDRNIVLVEALEKKVVELIPLPEQLAHRGGEPDKKTAAANAVGGFPGLSDEQAQTIYQSATAEAEPVPDYPPLRAGIELPGSIKLSPLPPNLGSEVPAVQGLQYSKLRDGRLLLVDPKNRKVVGVITRDEGTRVVQESKPEAGGDSTMGIGTGAMSRDPLRGREQTGNPSAYTGPTTTGPNTD
jgi:hypothetical protein